jgi:hypothetical protein
MTQCLFIEPGRTTMFALVALTVLAALCPACSADPATPPGAANALAALIEVPAPLSGENPRFPLVPTAPPATGKSVADSRLGTEQTRVVATKGLRHEYSRHDPYNRDCSKILLLLASQGEWRVYRTGGLPYDREENAVRTLSVEEPRWDNTDPNVLWGTAEFRIERINVETGETTIVKDFREDPIIGPVLKDQPDLYRITMKDEGEASLDRRVWAFIVQGSQEDYRARYLLVWDRQTDRVLGFRKLAANESNIDWVGMSPAGNWVLVGSDPDNAGDLAGFVMADCTLKQFHKLHFSTGHADVGFDMQGKEVVVMQNAQTDYIDLIPLDTSVKPIPPDSGYEDTGHIPLVRLFYASDSPVGLNSGVHVSCNCPGWCVVSTSSEPGAPEQNWLDRSIILVQLDRSRPRAFYLAKVYGTRGSYWEETHASMSCDGTRVIWATNWGLDIGKDKAWAVELRLPPDWQRLIPKSP